MGIGGESDFVWQHVKLLNVHVEYWSSSDMKWNRFYLNDNELENLELQMKPYSHDHQKIIQIFLLGQNLNLNLELKIIVIV